jgi:two-component system sensor histidine kinase CpxA
MNLVRRSLYIKIFLWFCLTAVVSSALVLLAASLTGTQPFGRRWTLITQDLYAHSAVDFYTTGGDASLRGYLHAIAQGSGIEGHLIDCSAAGDRDVLGAPLPAHTDGVYRRTLLTHTSSAHIGRFWTAASFVRSPGGHNFIFVMEAHPLSGFLDGTFIFSLAPRLAAGLLLAALLCLFLARHITRPVSLLQAAATRMAGGDLAVRTLPALAGRDDELASMAAAFDSMAERVETLLHNQRQMLADISHELRSPLTRIGVSLELLRRGETDVVEPIQADLDRLNLLIGQVLEVARLDLQSRSGPRLPVSLRTVLEDVAATANYEGRQRQRIVHLDVTEDCMTSGEEAALRSCLENIVRNALQYSPPGSAIEITVEQGHGLVSVRIDDAGPGVPPQYLREIFSPFFRVPDSATSHPHGTGLGLAISARIAAGFGGSVAAANRLPHGLSVTVTLPLLEAAGPTA